MVKLVMNGMSYFFFLVEYSNLASIGSIWDLKKDSSYSNFHISQGETKKGKMETGYFFGKPANPNIFFLNYTKEKGVQHALTRQKKRIERDEKGMMRLDGRRLQ